VDFDPNFGLAYAGMASVSKSLGQDQDAEKYIKEAMGHIDRMTERERYRTRALFYVIAGDQQKCVEEYSALVSRYASDVAAHNNLSFCYSLLRNIPKAIEETRLATEILPKKAVYRFNLAMYRTLAGDFQTAEKDVRAAQQLNPKYEKGYLTLAYTRLGQGELAQAAEIYQNLEKISPAGKSLATSALADLAVYEGRFKDAVRILDSEAAADSAAKRPDAAAEKYATLAYVELLRGQKGPALAALERALASSPSVKIRFLAGRVLAGAGETAKARTLAAALAKELKPEPQAYAKLIEAEAAIRDGDARQAISLATDANRLFDTWIGRFDLGRAYLEAGAFTEADSEFDRCIKRRGEAMELFIDDVATYGYFPPVYYYLGRVREGLKTAGFAESYRTYLNIRGKANEDPLLAEVRRRAGQ
jgi:eukaryotic-like serine/threonine-protein kinase